MTAPSDNDIEDENVARRTKSDGKGEQDGSFGGGQAGAGAGIGIILSTNKDKEVKGERRHLVAADLIEAIVEFFSDLPMRASANLSVKWEQTKSNVKSFALVNWIVEFGTKASQDLVKTRERIVTRDNRSLKQKNTPAFGGVPSGPSGPTGAGN